MVAGLPLQVAVVVPGAGGGIVPGAQVERLVSWVSSPRPSLSQSGSTTAEMFGRLSGTVVKFVVWPSGVSLGLAYSIVSPGAGNMQSTNLPVPAFRPSTSPGCTGTLIPE